MFPSLEIWACFFNLGHTQTMGVVVPRAPLVKIFRNHHCFYLRYAYIWCYTSYKVPSSFPTTTGNLYPWNMTVDCFDKTVVYICLDSEASSNRRLVIVLASFTVLFFFVDVLLLALLCRRYKRYLNLNLWKVMSLKLCERAFLWSFVPHIC